MITTWWMWALAGLALVVAEIAGSGFFLIFLALGALTSAALSWVWPETALWILVLAFSLVSSMSLLFFRKPMMKRFGMDGQPPSPPPEIVAEAAFPLEDILPGGTGKAALRGSSWTARNAGEVVLAKGGRCRVEHVDGLTIWIKAD